MSLFKEELHNHLKEYAQHLDAKDFTLNMAIEAAKYTVDKCTKISQGYIKCYIQSDYQIRDGIAADICKLANELK